MSNWLNVLVLPTCSIHETIQIIDDSGLQIALVVNLNRQLLGTVTDGDIRRAILKGFSLDETVEKIMNTDPVVVDNTASNKEILSVMKRKALRQIPVVNQSKIVINLILIDILLKTTRHCNWVILMAGGLGSRLAPLTHDCPKPLLKVGGKPILETIIVGFINEGFEKFFISVNYKHHLIEEYFENGDKWGVEICYLREQKPLGTAGSLKLLPDAPQHSVFVMNGDLLTRLSFESMLSFHEQHKSMATMAVREYDFQVPFGVVQTEDNRITNIIEKPLYKFDVNAGIYLLNPICFNLVPHNEYYDMPSLFKALAQEKKNIMSFPILDYWLDVGRIDDYEKANLEFREKFR